MDDPHLVACAAGGNVEALFKELLVAQAQRATLRSINQRDEDYVTLVTLKLRSVPAEQAMQFVTVRRQVASQQAVNRDCLLIADQRNHAKTHRLARFVNLVLG